MPLLTLHLLRLHNPQDKPSLLRTLSSTPSLELILASEPRYPVICPSKIDVSALTSTPWDLLLLLRGALPTSVRHYIAAEYKLIVGIPSRLLSTYPTRNAKLLAEAADVKLTGSLEKARERMKDSAQNLELSPDLLRFMDELTAEYGEKPVTMLNLLNFEREGKGAYYRYGQAFVKVAGLRGGDAKLVGNVVKPPQGQTDSRGDPVRAEEEWWNEISIVHYPSIRAFCDMLAGGDYQQINAEYRLAALRDTMLLCTTEIGLDSQRRNAKL